MVDGLNAGRLMRQADALRHRAKELPIATGAFPALLVPLSQVPQFDSQDPRLNRVETSVVSFHVVIILLGLAVVAQHPDLARKLLVVRGDGSGFSTRPQILSWIKAERRRLAHRPGLFPTAVFLRVVFRPMRLACVLNDDEIKVPGKLQDGIHVGRLTVEVHRHDRSYWLSGPPVYRLTSIYVEVA